MCPDLVPRSIESEKIDMAARGRSFWGLLPFLVIGIALIVAGFLADPSALTSDDIPLKPFLFVVGWNNN